MMKKYRKNKFQNLLLSLLLLFNNSFAIAQKQNISFKKHTFINIELNKIQYKNKKDFEKFFNSWNNKKPHIITIAHCGDSHIQPDKYTGVLRTDLQKIKGFGGRGMIFPYSIARTYSAVDYKSEHKGKWKTANSIHIKPKLPLGISGFTAITKDNSASFSINFKKALRSDYNIIKIFYKKDIKSFDFSIYIDGKEVSVPEETSDSYKKPYITISIPKVDKTVKLIVEKKRKEQQYFEFYGISIESDKSNGLICHNLGIGGAKYEAIILQKLFDEQFSHINADIVILDFGTNNYLYKDKIPENMEAVVIETIAKVRKATPGITILLTSAQDMRLRYKHIKSGDDFAKLIKKIAFEQSCLFYDWFWISGGNRSIELWQNKKLARRDGVHLTKSGYRLKGKLLAKAIVLLCNNNITESEMISDKLYEVIKTKSKNNYNKNKKKFDKNKFTYHIVRKGESLSIIARKYRTSVKQIMKDNKMRSTKIKIGRKLIIRK